MQSRSIEWELPRPPSSSRAAAGARDARRLPRSRRSCALTSANAHYESVTSTVKSGARSNRSSRRRRARAAHRESRSRQKHTVGYSSITPISLRSGAAAARFDARRGICADRGDAFCPSARATFLGERVTATTPGSSAAATGATASSGAHDSDNADSQSSKARSGAPRRSGIRVDEPSRAAHGTLACRAHVADRAHPRGRQAKPGGPTQSSVVDA